MAKKTVKPAYVDEDWQAEDDMRCLMRAREIKHDPKRLAKVKALAKKRLESMAGIASTEATK